MRTLRIAIVGYGIAGIAAAIQLRALGHRIDHFERRPQNASDGAGLLLQPPALKLLRDLGFDASLAHGARVSGYAAMDLEGRTLSSLRYADHSPGSHGLGMQRRHLVEGMSALDGGRDEVFFSKAVTRVDAERGILHFDDASSWGPYDLIVAADGANSPLRRACPGLVRRDRPCASAAVIACMDDPECLAGDRLVQYFDGARHVATWPVGATGEGVTGKTNISINVASTRADAFCDSGAWRGVIARHCPHLQPLLDRLGDEFRPIVCRYRDVVLNRFSIGRLVFLGDAAHSMSPLLGQGARLALLDAATLAQCMASSERLSLALDSFGRQCATRLGEFQWLSRWLTPIFQSEGRVPVALRQAIQLAQRIPMVSAKARALLLGEV